MKKVEEISMSFHNGQKKQMVNQIDEYVQNNGQSYGDFWKELSDYIFENNYVDGDAYMEFTEILVSYHRIKESQF